MKKFISTLLIFTALGCKVAFASDDGRLFLKCRPYSETSFATASIVKERGKVVLTRDSLVKRQAIFGSAGVFINEAAEVSSRSEKGTVINNLKRSMILGEACSPSNSIAFETIGSFGVPTFYPDAPVKVGEAWRKRLNITYDGREIPVTISYTFTAIERILDRDVAVMDVIMSGSNSGPERKRLAGIGREVIDVQSGQIILKIMEIKRGSSFVKDVDMELSYSESILDWW